MLRGMDLTHTFKHEVLMITTRDSGCSPSLYTRLYPVGDLVTDSEDRDAYEQLMAMVTATVDPTTWDEVGGPAAITVLPQARARRLAVA